MMRPVCPWTALLALAFVSQFQAAEPIVSGPKIGTRPGPYTFWVSTGVNRGQEAAPIIAEQTMFLVEVTPAAYTAAAANAAEKQAPIKLVYTAMLGATGRLIMAHRSPEVVNEAYLAALAAVGA